MFKREKIKSQKASVVRGWLTEKEMAVLGWDQLLDYIGIAWRISQGVTGPLIVSELRNKIKGAVQYCTRLRLVKSLGLEFALEGS